MLKPILCFVKKLTLTPDQITQANVNLIYEVGWDERTLLDTVRLCAVVNCMNRFAMDIGIDKKESGIQQTNVPCHQTDSRVPFLKTKPFNKII